MQMSKTAYTIAEELSRILSDIDDADAQTLAQQVVQAKRVFLVGAGRSLLMVKCCAMRLMQLGLVAYVPGEVVTPSIGSEDLLLAVSGSGETGSVVLMAKKAKAVGAKVALITMVPQSALGGIADSVMLIKGKSPKAAFADSVPSIQIGGGLFELSVLLFLEALVLNVVELKGIKDPDKLLMQNHANLE